MGVVCRKIVLYIDKLIQKQVHRFHYSCFGLFAFALGCPSMLSISSCLRAEVVVPSAFVTDSCRLLLYFSVTWVDACNGSHVGGEFGGSSSGIATFIVSCVSVSCSLSCIRYNRKVDLESTLIANNNLLRHV